MIKKIVLILLVISLSYLTLILTGYSKNDIQKEIIAVNNHKQNTDSPVLPIININQKKFLNAYSDFIDTLDNNKLTMKTGQVFIWDDGKDKSFDEKFNNADIEDIVSQEYLAGRDWNSPPALNFSPGRIRNTEFLKSIYGSTESEVRKNCVPLNWFGKKIYFNKINGAADSLKAVIKDLSLLPKELTKYYNVTAGTLYWRKIAGTNILSMHSFAIAIDINVTYGNYWRNTGTKTYLNKIPIEIVEAFEKHDFIWGGKWFHYDTMHFEFRPEFFQ